MVCRVRAFWSKLLVVLAHPPGSSILQMVGGAPAYRCVHGGEACLLSYFPGGVRLGSVDIRDSGAVP
jgi:hypothetical protein